MKVVNGTHHVIVAAGQTQLPIHLHNNKLRILSKKKKMYIFMGSSVESADVFQQSKVQMNLYK